MNGESLVQIAKKNDYGGIVKIIEEFIQKKKKARAVEAQIPEAGKEEKSNTRTRNKKKDQHHQNQGGGHGQVKFRKKYNIFHFLRFWADFL